MLQSKKRDRGCRNYIKEEERIKERNNTETKRENEGKNELRNEGWFASQQGKRDSEGVNYENSLERYDVRR